MTPISLRPYQHRSIAQVRAAMVSGHRRVLLCLPTGAGKTYTAASIVAGALSKGKRCLFVAHRLELIDQTVRAFSQLGINAVGVIRAGDIRRDADQPIQVASIQTLARRVQSDVDLVIIDEAHRSNSTSYTKHVFDRHAKVPILGLSATPVRGDGRPLGMHFDSLVVGAKYSELIAEGAIVAPLVYSTPVRPDMSAVRSSGGDFNQSDLEDAMNRGVLIGDLVAQWQRHPRQRTVVFAVGVKHSLAIVDMFRSAGVRAEHLDGTTKETDRRAILDRLSRGETELVSNVGVLCEGWDLPACKTLVLARPTKSLGLYMQMAGRILRPFEGLTPIVLDHGGNVDRHGLPHEDRDWDLSKKAKKASESPPVKACPSCFAYILSGSKVCPHCGHEFSAAEVDAELKASEPIPVDLELRTLDGDSTRVRAFRAIYATCRERGWRAMAAVHRYESRFGEPPPQRWVDALRADYRNDLVWKDRVRVKQAAKRAAEESSHE